MPQVRMTALQGHSTNDANGQPVWHDAGTSYDVDSSVVETLEGIGFAKRSDPGPDPFQSLPKAADDHTDTTTGPETSPPLVAAKSKRK